MKAITKFKKNKPIIREYAPNHILIIYDFGTALQSYDSIVAFRGNDGVITLGEDWDYSRTTMKYLGQWLRQNTKETRYCLDSGIFKYDEEL